ncbi:hypothetical protein E4U43_004622 [Claviceps pusilla]|uniref:Major facilitator superfamily (MFS) profile domain-containing protein n=1 Tax=Claviceps pusilla TaxID=123648 RepID=A0A9P7N4I5_9HYPO|nr:hypothetical protein E4U43_004622 [Claviceps pusilla]
MSSISNSDLDESTATQSIASSCTDVENQNQHASVTTPLLAATEVSSPFIVTFKRPFDDRNPLDWDVKRKWMVTNVLSATGFNRILVSTILAPALAAMARDLDMNSTESVMALSIYLLATAFGPLFIGPLTEVYGRQAVLHGSNIWFLAWNVLCGFADTKELLLVARFMAGFGASSVYSLAGGVLGDIWHPEQRGESLGWYLAIPLIAVAAGPILGGVITAYLSWRWMFWITSMVQAVMMLFCFRTFRETYAPVILHRIARDLRAETGNEKYQTIDECLRRQKSVYRVLASALSRPLRLLVCHPIIQISSIILAFNYGLLYLAMASFADLWMTQYRQSITVSGLHYIACALGELLGSRIGGPLMDRLFVYMQRRSYTGQHVPEFRLPLLIPGALIAPAGLLIYGWAAEYLVHWIVVDMGMFLALFGLQLIGLSMQAYVMDAYPDHISSALAASQFLRSLTAFAFPLFAPAMYAALGYGWGNSAVAVTGLVIGLPVPMLLWRFGARLRRESESSY